MKVLEVENLIRNYRRSSLKKSEQEIMIMEKDFTVRKR